LGLANQLAFSGLAVTGLVIGPSNLKHLADMMQPHYLFCQQIFPISFIYFPLNGKVLASHSWQGCQSYCF